MRFSSWHEFLHLVFDIDGTLVDSNVAHVWAWQDALSEENIFFPYFTLLSQMGLPGKHIVEKYRFALPSESLALKIAQRAGEIFSLKYGSLIHPVNGTHKLLRTLKRRGHKLHAVTSAGQGEALPMLRNFKLNSFFDIVITGDDVSEGKPSAEPFLILKEKIGARTPIISFGDSPYDLKASLSAGIPFVYLGHGGLPREWFERAHATFFNLNQLQESIPRARRSRPLHLRQTALSRMSSPLSLASRRPSVPSPKASSMKRSKL